MQMTFYKSRTKCSILRKFSGLKHLSIMKVVPKIRPPIFVALEAVTNPLWFCQRHDDMRDYFDMVH